MRFRRFAVMLLLLLALYQQSGGAQVGSFIDKPVLRRSIQRAVFDSEFRFLVADDSRDLKTLESLIATDYRHKGYSGIPLAKSAFLERLDDRARDYTKIKDVQVIASGRLAVVRGYLVAVEKESPIEAEYIRVWVLTGGRWRAAYYQETGGHPPD